MGQHLFKPRPRSGFTTATGTDHRRQKDTSEKKSPEQGSKLQCLLDDISPEIKENDSKLATELKNGIQRILEDAIVLLKNISIFKGCYIRVAGSLGEGSKIGLPIEQDYMLVIPMLEDKRLFKIEAPKGQRYKYIVTSNEMSLALSEIFQNIAIARTNILAGDCFVPFVTMALSKAISEHHSSWKIHKYCVKKSVIAFHLQYVTKDRNEYQVNLDLCLGFKSSHKCPQTVTEIINRRKQKASSYIKGVLRKADPLSYFVFFSPKLPNLGISASALENFYLKSLGRGNNRMKCYCIAKYFTGLFLPQVRAKTDTCIFCDEALIPSYYLKLSLLFMIENNDSDNYWSSEHLPDRVIEIFTTLLSRVQMDETLESVLIPNDPYLNRSLEKMFQEKDKQVRSLALEHGAKFTPIPTAHVTLKTALRTEDYDIIMPALFTKDSVCSCIVGSVAIVNFRDFLKNCLTEETVYLGPILEKFCETLQQLNSDRS